jgi:hypothetical protein
MSQILFKNQYPAQLATDLTTAATTIELKSGHGANFPAIALGEDKYFCVTVVDKAGNREIVKVIQRTSGTDILVVGTAIGHQPGGNVAGRAQESTTARAITASDDHVVELRLTAAIMQDITDRLAAAGVSVAAILAGSLTPTDVGDASFDVAAMQATADPYPAGTPSLATSLLDELKRIRYMLAQITGETQWYIDPDVSLAGIAADYYTKTNLQTSGQASVHAANLTDKTAIKHSEITDDEGGKHYLINDSGSGETDLWSASKIALALAGAGNAIHSAGIDAIAYGEDGYLPSGVLQARYAYWWFGVNPSGLVEGTCGGGIADGGEKVITGAADWKMLLWLQIEGYPPT